MKKIKRYAEKIEDEIHSAKDYAEKYVEYKLTKPQWSKWYHAMSEQELQHATYLHDMAVAEIEELNKVFQPTEEMEEKWEHSHKKYVEKSAWIRTMLAM